MYEQITNISGQCTSYVELHFEVTFFSKHFFLSREMNILELLQFQYYARHAHSSDKIVE